MDIQRYQEARLQQSHINFSIHPSRVAISLAAAFLINTVAAAAFIFLPFNIHPKKDTHQTQIYSVFLEKLEITSNKNQKNKIINNIKIVADNKRQKNYKQKHKHKLVKKNKKIKNEIQKISHKRPKNKIKCLHNAVAQHVEVRKTTPENTKQYSVKKITPSAKQNNVVKISYNSYATIFNWIASHKFYPLNAIYNGEEGEIILTFKIEKNGNIERIKIIKGSSEDLNKAAIKILKRSSPIPEEILSESHIKIPSKAKINIIFKLE